MFSKSMQKREASLYLPPERQARKILTAQDLYDMFNTRMTLHRRAYQHKTKNIIGIMICDALVAANDELMFTGENGVELRMSETINDMVAYTELTDNIFQMILRSSDIRLKRSRDILNNVLNRDLYDCVAQTQIKVVNLDYGMKNKDPVQNVRFYSKRNVNEALEIDKNQVSFVLPDTFAEQYVRVYCTVMDSYLTNVIEESFAEWCDENSHPQSQALLAKVTVKGNIYLITNPFCLSGSANGCDVRIKGTAPTHFQIIGERGIFSPAFPEKARKKTKVNPWTKEKLAAIYGTFVKNLRCLVVPNKKEFERARQNERALFRDWKNIKFRVHHEIQRLKKKDQPVTKEHTINVD